MTRTMSKFEVQDKMWDSHLSCGAVYTVAEAMKTEQVKERDMLVEVYDEGIGEKILIPGTTIKMMGTPGGVECGAPDLGRHTVEYLTKLGYDEAAISELAEKQIIQLA